MKNINFAALNSKLSTMKQRISAFFALFLYLGSGSLSAQTLQEGIQQLENENYNAALLTFIKLNSSDPKNTIYQYYIGEVHYAMENYDAAATAYKKGLEISSKCDACNVGLGKLDLDNGKPEEAKKKFDYALKGNSKNHEIHSMVGDAYTYSKKPISSLGIEYQTKARDINPSIAKYWTHLGDALQAKGDLGGAMTSYETAVSKNKNDPETYLKMARIWSGNKQTIDKAIENLETVISLNPNYALAYKDLYELYIRTNRYNKVLPILQKYVSLAGTDVDAKVRLVKFLCFQAKDYERAIEEGTKLLSSNPDQYTLHRWLAWSYGETNKFQESYDQSQLLFKAAETDPSRKLYASDYEYYAKAAAKIGKMDVAEQMYGKLIELEPTKSQDVYGLLAKTNYDAKKYDSARDWYLKKGTEKPLNNSDLFYLGNCYYYLDQNTQADSVFGKVVEITPNYATGWLMRAKANRELDPDNKLFLAKPYYEKFIEFGSADRERNKANLITAYNYLAYFYIQNNDNVQAKSYYEQTTLLDPTNQQAVEALTILNKMK
ncbi:MAG TPA: tetratricopeptide repeat protein [Saprospiraceae bacterium]|nr:tetratricopeptide repeat protein [Saprospiraceae bacterium]